MHCHNSIRETDILAVVKKFIVFLKNKQFLEHVIAQIRLRLGTAGFVQLHWTVSPRELMMELWYWTSETREQLVDYYWADESRVTDHGDTVSRAPCNRCSTNQNWQRSRKSHHLLSDNWRVMMSGNCSSITLSLVQSTYVTTSGGFRGVDHAPSRTSNVL